MTQEERDRSQSVLWLAFFALTGLVFAAIVVGAFELRAIYHLVEAQQWRSR